MANSHVIVGTGDQGIALHGWFRQRARCGVFAQVLTGALHYAFMDYRGLRRSNGAKGSYTIA